MTVRPIPEGYHSITPYLTVDDGARALTFYRDAFGATEMFRMPMGEKIGHAEIKIGDSVVMLSDEFPEMGHLGPKARGGPTSTLLIYIENVDTAFDKAIGAGATVERPVENQFWGDRSGTLVDPFGHRWMLSTHVEDVSAEEMERRMRQMPAMEAQPTPA